MARFNQGKKRWGRGVKSIKLENKKEVNNRHHKMQRIIRDYYKQLYTNKMDNLEDMDKFLTSLLYPSPTGSLSPGPLRPQGTVPGTHTLLFVPLHTHTLPSTVTDKFTHYLSNNTLSQEPQLLLAHILHINTYPGLSLPLSPALSLSVSPVSQSRVDKISVC